MDFEIHNRIYDIIYNINEYNEIYVYQFFIKPEHRNKHRHYSRRIFDSIMRKHNSYFLYLECIYHLIPFYEKCGFCCWSNNPNSWGGYEMWLKLD